MMQQTTDNYWAQASHLSSCDSTEKYSFHLGTIAGDWFVATVGPFSKSNDDMVTLVFAVTADRKPCGCPVVADVGEWACAGLTRNNAEAFHDATCKKWAAKPVAEAVR